MSTVTPLTTQNPRAEQGSVTMEYIIVSSFALLLSISAVTWIGKTIKSRIDHLAGKLGESADDFDIDMGIDTN